MTTLILLPGLDGTGLLFRDFAKSFGKDVNVVVISYPPDAVYGYEELEQLVRKSLPEDEPWFLLAESFSGPLGISIAASAPAGLRGLVLCCSFARNPVPLLQLLRPLLPFLPVQLAPVRLLDFFLSGRFGSPPLRAALAASLAQVKAAVLRKRAEAVLAVDMTSALSRIKVPVLYLRASEDRVVGASASALIAKHLRQVEIQDFVAPHFLLQVLPVPTAAMVEKFMNTARPI